MEGDRVTVTSSTQIPHIVHVQHKRQLLIADPHQSRRPGGGHVVLRHHHGHVICGQALGVPWGKIRVLKPYIGGGFGNKQDALYEPLCAWLTTQLGGP